MIKTTCATGIRGWLQRDAGKDPYQRKLAWDILREDHAPLADLYDFFDIPEKPLSPIEFLEFWELLMYDDAYAFIKFVLDQKENR